MACHVMLYNIFPVMLCYITNVMLCYNICHVMLCYITDFMSCYVI